MRKLLVLVVIIIVVIGVGSAASHRVLQGATTNHDGPVITSSYTLNDTKSDDLFVIADTAHLLKDSHVEADASLIGRSGVTIDGVVDGDLTVMGGAITMGKDAQINGDASLTGNSITLAGHVTGDLSVVAENVSVDPSWQIDGSLDVCANHLINENTTDISVRQCGSNKLAGWQSLRAGMFAAKPFSGGGFSLAGFAFTGLLALALAALSGLIVTIFPRRFGQMTQAIRTLPARVSRVGCLTQILAVALVAILGLVIAVLPPLGLILLPFLALLMLPLGILFIIGWMTIALLLGDWLLRRFARHTSPPMLTVIAGSLGFFFICTLLSVVPFGMPLIFVMVLLLGAVGLGAAIMTRVGTRSAVRSYFVQG
ncbi:MAG: polymer-forming cytoskeletal protein [Anaerolineae bacterium]|nr:polymer-forming cytoskeletal protein [Anaerolineae bacterium]